jgi:hypothetical protein
MALKIALCCNDPDNGSWIGKAEHIEIEGIEMYGPEVRVNHENRKLKSAGPAAGDTVLRVGRVLVPCLGYRTWWGNWCWDCASVRAMNALKVLNYLISRGWKCEQAACEVYDAINDGEPISGAQWTRFIEGGLLDG